MNTSLEDAPVIKRVRAILLTSDNHLLFIKRVKPHKPQPYWVAPGGGVEAHDISLFDALDRELYEELGATCRVLNEGFVLRHQKADKNLCEYFFVCRLVDYDISKRNGPEFNDPARGQFIPHPVELRHESIAPLNIKTPELKAWLLENLDDLRTLTNERG